VVSVRFIPSSPKDVTLHVEFRCEANCASSNGIAGQCDYAGDVRLVAGHLDDGFLGRAYTEECHRSPMTGLAIACGHLRSEVTTVVSGRSVRRTVAFHVPYTYQPKLGEAGWCQGGIVSVNENTPGDPTTSIDSRALTFDVSECAFDDPD
jgi:hypothetical protein